MPLTKNRLRAPFVARNFNWQANNVKRDLGICLNNRFSLFSFSPLCGHELKFWLSKSYFYCTVSYIILLKVIHALVIVISCGLCCCRRFWWPERWRFSSNGSFFHWSFWHHRRQSLGSLRCPYGDGNENVKKQLVKIGKTATLHVHHAFLYISLPSLHDYDVINCLISRLIDNVNIRRRISLTLC